MLLPLPHSSPVRGLTAAWAIQAAPVIWVLLLIVSSLSCHHVCGVWVRLLTLVPCPATRRRCLGAAADVSSLSCHQAAVFGYGC